MLDKTRNRVTLTDTPKDVIIKIAEGNPGALTVSMQILEQTPTIDPDCAMGGLMVLLGLDDLGIYGSKIWMLYKDVCKQSIPKTLSTLRAHQLGYITTIELMYGINSYGAGLNIDDLYDKVQERLPDFDKQNNDEPHMPK